MAENRKPADRMSSGQFINIQKHAAIRNGMRAILRDRIIQLYEDCAAKGKTPFYAVENVTTMYHAYHDLGGNGAITEIHHKSISLPQAAEKKGESK